MARPSGTGCAKGGVEQAEVVVDVVSRFPYSNWAQLRDQLGHLLADVVQARADCFGPFAAADVMASALS